jgi:C-terminal processing protease CtpA/Prc
LKALNDGYVFPETATKMETAVRERARKGEYDRITSGRKLAETLTSHLQEVSRDKHLRVRHSAEPLPPPQEGGPSPEEIAGYRRFLVARNYGFQKVERIRGNVGYLSLNAFIEPDLAGDTAAAAMGFLANTDALIVDLRENGGGDPAMVALLCTYLFPSEPVHLNSLYWREGDRTQQFWTLPYVPGKRYTGKEVYVLTSKRTFSGAEEFTYNLKNLKRATIIGETTGGGAHPGGTRRVTEHFAVWVPSGRAINPISKTNWEGTGVTPDVAVPADQALATAHLAALKRLKEKSSDPEQTEGLDDPIRDAEKELAALKKKQASADLELR